MSKVYIEGKSFNTSTSDFVAKTVSIKGVDIEEIRFFNTLLEQSKDLWKNEGLYLPMVIEINNLLFKAHIINVNIDKIDLIELEFKIYEKVIQGLG